MRRNVHRTGWMLVLLTVLGAPATTGWAQVQQPHRFEREQKNSDDYYNVISLKEEGLALYRERDKYKNSNRIWELLLLDTALQEKRVVELEIKERYKMVGYEVTAGQLYFLYRTGETTRNDFELVRVTLASGEYTRYSIKPDLDFKLTHFSKAGGSFAFGGYVNNEPAIFLYELETGNRKVVPGFFQKDTELVDLRTNQNGTFNTVTIDRGSKGDRFMLFRTFDGSGELLLEDRVPIEENRTLQTGITSTLEREDLVLLGTWGERNSKQSNGFYSLVVDPFNEQKIRYFSFGELTHYLEYLSPKRMKKIQEDTREDLAANKIPNYINYVMPFKLNEYRDGYLLLAEVYTPSSNLNPYYSNPYYYNPYSYSPYGSYGMYGPGYYYPGMGRMYRPYAYGNNVKNNDDIKSSETVLLAFDAAGKVKWDHSLKLEDIKLPSVEQVADFSLKNGHVHLLYKNESDLMVKSIPLKEDTTQLLQEKIKLLDPVDEIRSEKEGEGSVRHWYDNTFYVWGYQTIRNVTKTDRVRDVFYINKVVVH
ncbi:hypothetical protein [Parachryseolinea silvisoli]|uniref:hypothetical protein n=1 Tax=Parachryseolinea silvisoli TaxID=2873601 RepID=UPI002265912E|nr:hypothetical protein [Parachryseolinea silvisoli]MCD9019474.1 hypothetical protein [Parachryseolinea silvisoli]